MQLSTRRKINESVSLNGIGQYSLLVLSALVFFTSCANKVSPTGGEKDITPPKLTGSFPANFSVNFKAKQAVLNFNEFIQLNGLQKQLIVSPPMDPMPEVLVKRKSLQIKMPANLRENTTYTMNFGESVADVHEGNVARNFQYVFSTGPILDSLQIKGSVIYANNLVKEKDILVMLYADSSGNDSLPFKSLPSYFAKTDSSGNFAVTNISPGAYKIFALKDQDNNYLYNRTDEAIGFLFNPIEAGDSNATEIRLFSETPKLALKKMTTAYPGKIIASFSAPVKKLQVIPYENEGNKMPWAFLEQNKLKDTCIFWINDTLADSLKVIFYDGQNVIDTAFIKLQSDIKKNFGLKKNSRKLSVLSNTAGGILERSDSLFISLPYPLAEYDLRKIIILEDSLAIKDPEFLFDTDLKMNLKVNLKFKSGSQYDIFLPPGTFMAFNGFTNDSVKFHFKLREETDYGSLMLKLTAPEIGFDYVLLLLDENDRIIRTAIIKPQSKTLFEFLDPGQYRLKIIYDGNANKRWDTGNYKEKTQPERVYYYKDPITIRANWDLETEWQLTR